MVRKDESAEPAAIVAAGSFSADAGDGAVPEDSAMPHSGAGADEVLVLDAVPVDDDALDVVSIKQLTGKKVWEGHSSGADADGNGSSDGALKKIGRVSFFVFHPVQNRCVGFLVKRPDLALMFRRKDLFVSFSGFDIIDRRIVAGDASGAKGKSALKALDVDLEECVVWQGLPVVCENGAQLGTVGDVLCELGSGRVHLLEVSKGATANALLGTLRVLADEIVGFRMCTEESEAATRRFPAIVVADAVQMRSVEGGVAEKAGSATAVIAHNAKQAIDKVKPKAKEAGAAAGEAVNKGAYIAGRQIGRTDGMFKAFKEEFDKALHED